MHWLNLQTSVLHAPEFVGCRPVARATWLAVMLWCVQQENGGRIAGARTWKTRRWQQTCGVTLKEIDASGPLLSWEGDDLVAWSYPAEKEHEVRINRAKGAIGGRVSSEAKAAARAHGETPAGKLRASPNDTSQIASTPVGGSISAQADSQAVAQAGGQRKGKERNGKEKKATGHAHDGGDCDEGGGLITAGAPRSAEGTASATVAASEGRSDSATALAVERVEHRALLRTAAAPGLALALGSAVDSAPGPRNPAQVEHSAAGEMAGPMGLSTATKVSAATGLEPALGAAAAAAADALNGDGTARGDGNRAMESRNSRAPEGASDGDGQAAGEREGGWVPTLAEVVAYGSSPHGNAPEEVCAVWWNDHEARPRHALGGYTDRTGQPVRNWRASLRAFALRWRNQEEQQQRRHQPPSRGPRAAPVPRALQGPQRPPAVGFRVGF